MRALAWWQATPELPEQPQQKKDQKPPKRISRGAAVRAEGGEVEMPDIEPETSYLVDTLMEAGPVSPAGMGTTVLSWADLQAWQHGTGIALAPWEARLVRQLSAEYLQESRRAEAHDALPPWLDSEEEQERHRKALNARRLRDSMRAQAQQKK